MQNYLCEEKFNPKSLNEEKNACSPIDCQEKFRSRAEIPLEVEARL